MNIELIKVGNGNSKYPGNFTKIENKIINNNIIGKSLNLFSGKSLIGNCRIDYNCKEATVNTDVFKYLDLCIEFNYKFNTIIIDAPYNKKFAKKYQTLGNTPEQFIIFANTKKTTELFNKIKILNPDIIILKSWNYYCLKNMKIKNIFICYAGGYRKPTFLIIMKKD